MRVPNILTTFSALHLAWIPRLLQSENCTDESWLYIPSYQFKRYGGLRCNHDSHYLKQIDRSIYQDVLNDEGGLLSYKKFLQKYNLNCNFLRYFQILAAILKHLPEKARQTSLHKHKFQKDNFIFSLSPTVSINLLKMKSKDFYWLIVNKSKTEGTGPRKLEHEIQLINLNCSCYFKKLNVICKETNLREFYCKFLHRIIVEKELYYFGIESNKDCLYCKKVTRYVILLLTAAFPSLFPVMF